LIFQAVFDIFSNTEGYAPSENPTFKETIEMADYTKNITQAQEQAFQAAKLLAKAQDQALATFKEVQGKFLPDQLPTATQAVEASYAVATNILQFQKEATLRWIETMTTVRAPRPATTEK
jgi:hypothetical protein